MNREQLVQFLIKKNDELQDHRIAAVYIDGTIKRHLPENVYNHLMAVISSQIAACEISIRHHERDMERMDWPEYASVEPSTSGAKMTFGLTEKNLEIIKRHTSRWEGAEFGRDTWVDAGKEIGWEPLTACLWYFRKSNKQ